MPWEIKMEDGKHCVYKQGANKAITCHDTHEQAVRHMRALYANVKEGYAKWTTAYINDLPDSAFLYIETGGKKDSEGKTVPRSLRHFPVKDANGKIDLPHVRNAIARAPQSTLPDGVKARVQAKARAMLGKGAMSMGLIPNDQKYVFSFSGTTQYTKDELMNGVWIQAVPYDTVQHPLFGEVTMDRSRADGMKSNFDTQVYGSDIKINYEHFGVDKAKGLKAAGWVKEVEPREDGFWWKIAFTGEAATEILDGAWRYFSAEWDRMYTDPYGVNHTDVISGGALTNDPFFSGMVPLNFSKLMNESADMEHSEPGTGPTPREDEPHEPGQAQGTRAPSKPNPEPDIPDELEASMNDEELAALREKLGLADDGDITEAVDQLIAEVTPIRDAAEQAEEALAFSKKFPKEYEELQQLKASDRDAKAKTFSEHYSKVRLVKEPKEEGKEGEVTSYGFSARAIAAIEEAHIAMSSGSLREEHLKKLLDSAMGLVDYGEHGSSVVNEEPENASEAFSQKVAELMVEDKLGVSEATRLAASKHPELYKAYRESVGARA